MSGDFKPFEVGTASAFSGEQDYKSPDFRVSRDLSQAIVDNPGLREVLEEEVNKRVEQRLREEQAQKIQSYCEEGRRLGREEGLEQAKVEMQVFKEKLSLLAKEILEQKQAILHDHEEAWCRALRSVLEKCFISRSKNFALDVSRWLSEYVDWKTEGQGVRVLVATSEYEAFRKEWELAGGSGVEFEASSDLREGEFRFKSEAGEVFFSPEKALEKLDAIITNHFEREAE